ncbi:SMU1112c/YaeR family gloxylase I-like metalloprotein [Ferdinandcohnia quinoae]|uniref:VOC family protein n=1 Tax=Fredinandcohnia quinoae TaxID=2918902 RepID=A0AAW5E6F4_9BACI|nr:VOC family protein [Fredinandcohnia sp. SECRCQ15]MCH1625195.1 VOC family protein [Fredinandcohnia sp. SECRCQ15]
MKLKRIHHIAIICSDYPASKHFYTTILGLQIIGETFRKERDSYKLDLAIGGDYQIELFSFPAPPKRINFPEACGLRHLAFEVENIEEAVEDISGHGIPVEHIRVDPITNKKYTFLTDPDGLPIELYEK